MESKYHDSSHTWYFTSIERPSITTKSFIRSLQTGRLLEVISAHEGPVSSLQFCPSVASSQLATVSWDKTLRLWDALAVGNNNESIPLVSDATAVAFRPGE